jgi:transcription antitermination factor NusG
MMHVPFCYRAGLHWFAAYTNIKCETRAQLGVAALGYRAYLPEFTKWVTHSRVRTVVKRPLFNRYLFVELDPSRDGFGEIRDVNGIEAMVGNSGVPMVMPERFIADLMHRQLSGEFDYASEEAFQVGARVKIVQGQFDELLATVISAKVGSSMVDVKIVGEAKSIRMHTSGVRAVAC